MIVLKTFGLFVLTAIAELVGCYLPYLWLRKSGSPWLLLPGAASLALFAWLLRDEGSDAFLLAVLALLAVQLALGAWLSIVDRAGAALPAHGLIAIVLSALLAWLARGKALPLALAIAAPLAGFSALHYEYSARAALVHAIAAAALLAAAVGALGRRP